MADSNIPASVVQPEQQHLTERIHDAEADLNRLLAEVATMGISMTVSIATIGTVGSRGVDIAFPSISAIRDISAEVADSIEQARDAVTSAVLAADHAGLSTEASVTQLDGQQQTRQVAVHLSVRQRVESS